MTLIESTAPRGSRHRQKEAGYLDREEDSARDEARRGGGSVTLGYRTDGERDPSVRETPGEVSRMRKRPYSGPTRWEVNLGFRESRREIRNGIKSYGRKRRT